MRKSAQAKAKPTATPKVSTKCTCGHAHTDKGGTPRKAPALPGEHLDPATLKRGDQFTATILAGPMTCIYLGAMRSGANEIIHEFQPYITTPGQPPEPAGHLTLMEGRDIGKDLPCPFGMTRITKDNPQWINNPDTSLGNLIDALGELQAIEEAQGEAAAFNPMTMMDVFLKHMPEVAKKELQAILGTATAKPGAK